MRKSIKYDYMVYNISENDSPAYKIVVPLLNGVIFGENLKEIEEGIEFSVEEEIKEKRYEKLQTIQKRNIER